MLVSLRSLFIYLFAAAFVFNGVLLHANIELPVALTLHAHLGFATATDRAPHPHAVPIGQEELTAISGDHDDSLPHNHIDGGPKSCGMCSEATVMSGLAATAVQLSYALISFDARPPGLTGHLVALDPDIPKTSA